MRPPLLACALLVQPGLLLALPGSYDTRQAFEMLQSALDGAVVQVSRPAAAWPAHPVAAGYRLPGYGAVVVLPARSLPPARPSPRPADPRLTRALAEARRTLEQSLGSADTPEMREQIQRSLEVLRKTQVHLGAVPPAPTFPELSRAPLPLGERGQAEAEREVELMHQEMEAFRREAEQAREEAEHDIRVRLAAPVAPMIPLDTPQPPWHFWFEATTSTTQERDSRTPDAVVAAVRAAVSNVLEGLRIPYDWLGENDTLAVVVDFMPRGAGRPARGLSVRAKRGDLMDLRNGVIDAAEFRRRIETEEWPAAAPITPEAPAAAAIPPTQEPEPHP